MWIIIRSNQCSNRIKFKIKEHMQRLHIYICIMKICNHANNVCNSANLWNARLELPSHTASSLVFPSWSKMHLMEFIFSKYQMENLRGVIFNNIVYLDIQTCLLSTTTSWNVRHIFSTMPWFWVSVHDY